MRAGEVSSLISTGEYHVKIRELLNLCGSTLA